MGEPRLTPETEAEIRRVVNEAAGIEPPHVCSDECERVWCVRKFSDQWLLTSHGREWIPLLWAELQAVREERDAFAEESRAQSLRIQRLVDGASVQSWGIAALQAEAGEAQRLRRELDEARVGLAGLDELRESLRGAMELFGRHSGHWDPTGRSGTGCSVCIEQREFRDAHKELLQKPETESEGL